MRLAKNLEFRGNSASATLLSDAHKEMLEMLVKLKDLEEWARLKREEIQATLSKALAA